MDFQAKVGARDKFHQIRSRTRTNSFINLVVHIILDQGGVRGGHGVHLGEHADENVRPRQGPSRRPEIRRVVRSTHRQRLRQQQDHRRKEHRARPLGRVHHQHPRRQHQARRLLPGSVAPSRLTWSSFSQIPRWDLIVPVYSALSSIRLRRFDFLEDYLLPMIAQADEWLFFHAKIFLFSFPSSHPVHLIRHRGNSWRT